MKTKIAMITIILVCSMCACKRAEGDWAFRFVVWDENMYKTTEVQVPAESVGNPLGEISRFVNSEGTYDAGITFSNAFQVGTGLYEIAGVSTDTAIAVEANENMYIKAEYAGKYGEKS